MASTMHLSILPLVLMALTSCALAWDFDLVPWDLHPVEDPPFPMAHPPHNVDYHAPPIDYPHPPMEYHPMMGYPPLPNPRLRHNSPAMGPAGFGHRPSPLTHEHPPPNGHLPPPPYPAFLPPPPPPSKPGGPPTMWGTNGKFMPFPGSENVLWGETQKERLPAPRPAAGHDPAHADTADSPRPAHIMDHPMARDLMAAILAAARLGHSGLADKRNAPVGFGQRESRAAVPLNSGTHTKLEKIVIDRLIAFKSKMNAPQPDLGLPVLDPYVLDKYSFHIQNSTMQISGQLENTTVVGLSWFTVEKLKLYLVQTLGVVQISIPKVEIRIGYNVDNGSWFTPLKIPFYGAGELRIELGPIDTLVRAEVSIHDKQLGMQSLSIDYNFGAIECALKQQSPHGSFTDNPHLDELMSRVVVDLVPRLAREWRPALEKQVALKLDDELKRLNWKDILDNFD